MVIALVLFKPAYILELHYGYHPNVIKKMQEKFMFHSFSIYLYKRIIFKTRQPQIKYLDFTTADKLTILPATASCLNR